jgi:hypothetical protein
LANESGKTVHGTFRERGYPQLIPLFGKGKFEQVNSACLKWNRPGDGIARPVYGQE